MSNKVNACQIELFSKRSAKDWTYAIHQELNIRRRACTTFIPKDRTNNSHEEVRCGCKRFRREHSWDVQDSDKTKWDPKKHTTAAENNAFGFLPNSAIHYVRCDLETPPSVLAELVYEVWKVKPPKLIMCIIGGAKYFKLNERLEREFIKGIIQAALKADGWLITPGFKTGVVQLVGEAIHDHRVTNPRSRITAIGCSKWGATRNREALILKKSSTIQLNGKAKAEKGQQDLEPNHTHFLLLDDGTYYNYELDDYRTRFVIEVSKYKNDNVPIVTIVVEGGPDTLSAIYKDLRNDIPVVLIDGSGRVPNLLSSFLTRTEMMVNQSTNKENSTDANEIIDVDDRERLQNLFCHYEKEIRNGLKDISKGSRSTDEEINKLFYYFLYCLQPAIRNRIRIFSLDSDHDLDDTIFEAIIQVKQANQGLDRDKLLKLALAWDAIEVAKEHIIKDDLDDLTSESKTKLFFEALTLDRPQFVHAFIKLNFNLSDMFYEKQTNKPWKLKWLQLQKLYNENEEKKKKERLYLFHRDYLESPSDLDEILRKLIGDYMRPIYGRTERKCCGFSRLTRVGDSRIENEDEAIDPEEAKTQVRELVFRDLFLWSILTNRIEMSKVFLSHMNTRICAALIASKISKSYLSFAFDNESQDILRLQADQFEEYANECLKSCYNYDEDKACEIAIRQIHIFGDVSSVQIAVDADDKNFVGQPCCDQLLTNIWYDKIEPYQANLSNRLRLLLSISTFGLLSSILLCFRKEKYFHEEKFDQQLIINQNQPDNHPEQLKLKQIKRLNNNGINYSDNYIWMSNQCYKSCSTFFRRLKYFHQAPMIKYAYDTISYLIFLLFFSYYLLFELRHANDIHWSEIYVIVTITTMLIEEIRQFLCQDNRSMSGKFLNYFVTNQFSNMIRVISYLLFYIGLILRFAKQNSEQEFVSAKIVLAYDLEIWFIRLLAFLGVAQNMGPKLVMIRKMITDLFFFTFIIFTAMTAYGVASRAMYDYSEALTFDARSILRNIIYPTYYIMYGNVEEELAELDHNRDTSPAIATHVLLAFHMLLVNILLINLLIAMFSFTFTSVQNQTDLVWRYERYSLIREYFDRPPLFPPFIMLTHAYELGKFIFHQFANDQKKINTKIFKMIAANHEVDKDWSEFESYATNLFARSIVQLNSKQQTPSNIIEHNSSGFESKSLSDEIVSLKKTLVDLRTSSEEMNRCMQWMMDAMERVKMSKEPKPTLKSAINTIDIQYVNE